METVLGDEELTQLRAVWRAAFRVADDDTDAMLDLGRRWCRIIGPDPDTTPPHLSEPTEDTTTTDSSGPHVRSPLADAVGKTLGKVARAVARVKLPDDPAEIPARKKADAARRKAERLPTPYSPPPVDPATANRDQRHPPTDPDERTAARVLARA